MCRKDGENPGTSYMGQGHMSVIRGSLREVDREGRGGQVSGASRRDTRRGYCNVGICGNKARADGEEGQ